MKRYIAHLLLFVFCCFLGGCKNKMQLDENAIPEVLLIGVYGGEGPADETIERLGPIGKYLEERLGMKVEFTMTTDYTAIVEAIHAKKIHVAYLPPFAYILAERKGDVVPLVTAGIDGKPALYKSILVTSKNSGLKSMDDVKKNAKNLTLCFTDPASTSGHLLPRAYLTSIGLEPEEKFKQTLFASGHTASVMSVKAGKVDIGCTLVLAIERLTRKGLIDEGEIITLWTSGPVVSNAIAIRKDINPEFSKKVQQAYLDLPEDAPDAWRNYLVSIYGESFHEERSYIVAHDSIFDDLREMVKGIADLSTIR